MGIEKTIIIKADTKKAVTETEKLTDAIDRLVEEQKNANVQAKKTAEETKKRLEAQKKALEESRKPLNRLKTGFKGLGTAIKATGIGLVIGLVAKLGQTFSGNSKVVNFFSNAMIALDKAFNDLFNFIFNNFGKWTQFIKDAFENPQKTIKSFAEAIKDNLIERFDSLIETLGFVGKAFKQLFSGDFKGALESVKEAGKEFVDVYTGVDGTVDKVTEAVKEGVEAVKEYATETVNASKQVNKLRSSFAQIENQQTRLREAADRDAEAQRRLRDDTTKTIEERIKANERLADVLDKQEEAEKATVQARISGLQQEQALLGFRQERANEIFALQTELIAIEAQQAGFRAEQEANAIALQQERIDLSQTELDAQKERQLAQLQFEAEQEENESQKIIKLQERLALENELIAEDIERKRELFAEGTQARVDAEQEFLNKFEDLKRQEVAFDKQAKDAEEKQEQAVSNAKIGIAKNTLGLLQEVAGEGSKAGKALAVAQATISAFEGAQNAFTTAAKSPITTVFPAYPFAQAGVAGAFGAVQVQKILSTKTDGSGGGASASSFGGGTSAPAVQAPSFNLVQGTGTDQIAETIQGQDQPIKAFVVSSDVSTAQELDRNAVETASL